VIEQSLPPERADAIRTLNKQYRNFKTVEPLLEKSVGGRINPTDLMNRVASSKFIKASRKDIGQDELVDLAEIGKFMTKQGGSDTAQKQAVMGGLYGLGGTAAYFDPLSAGVALGANRILQKVNQSSGLLEKSVEKSLPRVRIDIRNGKGK
jgi:hypothetical protein